MWKADITVTYKDGILEPQGATLIHSLDSLGFKGVNRVKVGKLIEVTLSDELTEEKANSQVKSMCEKLLANVVMEKYDFTVSKI